MFININAPAPLKLFPSGFFCFVFWLALGVNCTIYKFLYNRPNRRIALALKVGTLFLWLGVVGGCGNSPKKICCTAKTAENKNIIEEPWGIHRASFFFYPGLVFHVKKNSCTTYCSPFHNLTVRKTFSCPRKVQKIYCFILKNKWGAVNK